MRFERVSGSTAAAFVTRQTAASPGLTGSTGDCSGILRRKQQPVVGRTIHPNDVKARPTPSMACSPANPGPVEDRA
jgi:hypothetical protein